MVIDGTINIPTIITVVTIAIGAVAWLVRMESRVNTNTSNHKSLSADFAKEALELNKRIDAQNALIQFTQNDLHEHKTKTAEQYVTKAGMSEQTDRIMKSIADVGNRIDQIGTRLDRFYETQPARSTRRSSGQ